MPQEPLTREQLDSLKCVHCAEGASEDHPLALHSQCHPQTPTWAFYDKATGTIIIECAECERVITRIAVANARDRREYSTLH